MNNTSNETNNDAVLVFYSERAISIIGILLSLYVLLISCFKSVHNKLLFTIENHITISCIIHMIPYLFPPQDLNRKQQHYSDPIPFICKVSVSMHSLSHYNSLMFPALLTYILYLSFSNPQKIETNQRMLKYCIPFLFWNRRWFKCWFFGDFEVIAHIVLSIVYYLVLFVFLIKIKNLLLNMINKEELKKEEGGKYLKSFKKFFVFVGGSFSSLILSIIE